MVSADNLNLDVLELIFAFLSGNDLPSVASVSRSFLAGVIPKLYRRIWFQLRQAKGYDVVSCCYATTLRLKLKLLEGQNNVAFCHITGPSSSSCSCSKYRYVNVFFSCVHLEFRMYFFLELRAIPTLKSRLHPVFVRECTEGIRMCKNLKRFLCTVPNILAIFLPSLQEKSRLEHIRIHASLTTNQTKMLTNFEKLQSLVLESATWNVVDLLPSWAGIIQKTLTCLTLYVSFYSFCSCFFSF